MDAKSLLTNHTVQMVGVGIISFAVGAGFTAGIQFLRNRAKSEAEQPINTSLKYEKDNSNGGYDRDVVKCPPVEVVETRISAPVIVEDIFPHNVEPGEIPFSDAEVADAEFDRDEKAEDAYRPRPISSRQYFEEFNGEYAKLEWLYYETDGTFVDENNHPVHDPEYFLGEECWEVVEEGNEIVCFRNEAMLKDYKVELIPESYLDTHTSRPVETKDVDADGYHIPRARRSAYDDE